MQTASTRSIHIRKQDSSRWGRARKQGSVLVEALLVSPVLLLLVLGTIEFGQAMTVSQTLQEEACRAAEQIADRKVEVATVQQELPGELARTLEVPSEVIGVNIQQSESRGQNRPVTHRSTGSGNLVDVRVSVPFAYVAQFSGAFLHDTTLEGHCIVRRD